jgi:hypothetical protein
LDEAAGVCGGRGELGVLLSVSKFTRLQGGQKIAVSEVFGSEWEAVEESFFTEVRGWIEVGG